MSDEKVSVQDAMNKAVEDLLYATRSTGGIQIPRAVDAVKYAWTAVKREVWPPQVPPEWVKKVADTLMPLICSWGDVKTVDVIDLGRGWPALVFRFEETSEFIVPLPVSVGKDVAIKALEEAGIDVGE